ncbi:MAG TPA: hypothetical protein VFJ43_18210 [Bacteroidia bacterium]|nr:hypothetical protein [Bacteroidia bacterium]
MKAVFLFAIVILSGCDLDIKTDTPRGSRSIEESKSKGYFKFEMHTANQVLELDSGRTFEINSIFVENCWMYKRKHWEAVEEKQNKLQMVIVGTINPSGYLNPYFFTSNNKWGIISPLIFDYNGEDTLHLFFAKDFVNFRPVDFYK